MGQDSLDTSKKQISSFAHNDLWKFCFKHT